MISCQPVRILSSGSWCGGAQTLKHVLSTCKEAQGKGRFTWRHNEVLRELVKALDAACLSFNGSEDDEAAAGRAAVHLGGILGKARDWNLYADLAGRREYPCVVKETGARPDLIIMSESCKILVIVELTVRYET